MDDAYCPKKALCMEVILPAYRRIFQFPPVASIYVLIGLYLPNACRNTKATNDCDIKLATASSVLKRK